MSQPPPATRHDVANALLAAQCPAGVCARDVDQLDRALRGRLYLQADNLIRDPSALLAALGAVIAPCEACRGGQEHVIGETRGGYPIVCGCGCVGCDWTALCPSCRGSGKVIPHPADDPTEAPQ